MEINKLIEYSQQDKIGKYYLSKAVTFAFNYEFGKAYEFLKEGLDILTCDCQSGWLKPNAETNKKVFNDIIVKHIPHFEYYFVKAYIMSYEEDRKSQYLALDAIDKYLESQNDENGHYVKGKILLALNEPTQALISFKDATLYGSNKRLLYRLGRTKEQYLEQTGLKELYYSFVQNPSSACCARNLKKYMKERDYFLPLKNYETNILLDAFNKGEDEWVFQRLYEKVLKIQLDNNKLPFNVDEITKIVNFFVLSIKNNANIFINGNIDNLENYNYDELDYNGNEYYDNDDEDDEDGYGGYDGYEGYEGYDDYDDYGGVNWDYYNDNLDMDQQCFEFWN